MPYEIVFARSARRELQRLPENERRRIFDRIQRLADDPRPRGSKKLRGAQDLWRIRSGDYRVIYAINDETELVDITIVRHRSDAYR